MGKQYHTASSFVPHSKSVTRSIPFSMKGTTVRDLTTPRRRFWVRKALPATTVLLCACLAIAGCTSSFSKSTSTSSGDGTLTVATLISPSSLNPALNGNGAGYPNLVQWLGYEPLIRAMSNGSYAPGLATTWHYVGSGNTRFAMTIRSGATFADGSPVTAASVAACLNYYLKTPGPDSTYLAGIKSVTASGTTVSVDLSSPNPLMPFVFSQMTNYGDIVSPAGLADPSRLGTDVFGAGPYTLDAGATVAGDHYTFIKNPKYWNPGQQHYAKVVVKVITDANSALQALTSGQVNVDMSADRSLMAQAKAAGASAISGSPSTYSVFLLDRDGVTASAMGNLQVRQALNYAIDRNGIAAALGNGATPTDQIAAEGTDGYDPALDNIYPYDPAKAKSMLAAAGYPNGFTINLLDASVHGLDVIAQAVAQQLGAIGVHVEITNIGTSVPTLIADLATKKYTALSWDMAPPMYANAQQNFTTLMSPVNPFHSTDSAISSAFTALATADAGQQTAAAQALNKAAVDQAWFIPTAASSLYLFAQGVDNLGTISGVGAIDVLSWTAKSS